MDNSNFNLPTPQALTKRVKEEMVPVSLRVKESTVAAFDKMSRDAGISRGTMINSLLDFYAQNFGSFKKGDQGVSNSKAIMRSYLENTCRVILRSSSSDLIVRMQASDIEYGEAFDVIGLLELYKKKEKSGAWIGLPALDGNGASDYINFGSTIEAICNDDSWDLTVSYEQWPAISLLLVRYYQKYKKLFPYHKVCITSDMCKKIAQACEQHMKPDKALMSAVKDILLDFVEDQDD